MTIVPKTLPPSTPDEAKRLTEFAQLLPEPARHAVTLYAEHVHIECEAGKMGATHRARTARVHQLALLGLAAYGTCDGQWDPDSPRDGQEVLRVLCDYRVKLLEMCGAPQTGLFDGAHEYMPGEDPPW